MAIMAAARQPSFAFMIFSVLSMMAAIVDNSAGPRHHRTVMLYFNSVRRYGPVFHEPDFARCAGSFGQRQVHCLPDVSEGTNKFVRTPHVDNEKRGISLDTRRKFCRVNP
jgi:hypothetical protein